MKYLSSKEVSEKFAQSGLIVPARVDVASSKFFKDGKKPLNYEAFLNAAQNSRPTPVTVNYNEILDDLRTKTEHIFNH
jgi:ABC-type glycerol-3-phosphate transport system substrate-binding protein